MNKLKSHQEKILKEFKERYFDEDGCVFPEDAWDMENFILKALSEHDSLICEMLEEEKESTRAVASSFNEYSRFLVMGLSRAQELIRGGKE